MRIKVTIIALNLVIIAYLLIFLRPGGKVYRPLRYDTVFPRIDARPVSGGDLSMDMGLRGRNGIVFYCHHEIPWQEVYYGRILLDRYQDHGDGLRVFLVVDRNLESEAPRLAGELGYPVVVDTDAEIREALHLSPGSNGTFIVASDRKLKLVRIGIPSRDELRQHVEKLLLGEIFYEPSAVARLGPSMELPAIAAMDLSSGQPVVIRPGDDSVYVFFTARLCASCNTAPYYDELLSLTDLIRRKPQLQGKEIRLLLTASYPLEEVAMELSERGLDLAVYRATETLRGLEDDYFTKRTSEAGVLVAMFDGAGKVSFIEPIEHALEDLENEEESHAD